MLTDFVGKVAVVTGAASGIGRALCEGFAAHGMHVVVADIDESGADEVASGLESSIGLAVDVAEAAAVEDLADAAFDRWGQVDLLCNNAGVFQAGLSWERRIEDWDWALGVNLYGIIHGIRSFIPRMIDQGTPGHVVNTSSVAAFVTAAATGPYTVSKSAAFSLTECLAHDLASVDSKIGASVLTPSAFNTGIASTARVRPERYGTDGSGDAAAMNEGLAALTSLGLDPADVVEPVIEGVRTGTFLIPTRPSHQQQLEGRFTALRKRDLPGVTIVD